LGLNFITSPKKVKKNLPPNFLLASGTFSCYSKKYLEAPLTTRGRQITPEHLPLILSLIQTRLHRGRKFISRELCRQWQWYQPNWNLKDMTCREFLFRLERMGLIQVPQGETPPSMKDAIVGGVILRPIGSILK